MLWQVLPVTDGAELEGACESLVLLLDKRQAFYRHTGAPGSAAAGGAASASAAGTEGEDPLSLLTEEDWRAGVGFADWVGVYMLFVCVFMIFAKVSCLYVYVSMIFANISCLCVCVHDFCESILLECVCVSVFL